MQKGLIGLALGPRATMDRERFNVLEPPVLELQELFTPGWGNGIRLKSVL